MNCEEIKTMMYYYIYKELQPRISEYIMNHLKECNECNQYYKKMCKEIKEHEDIENLSAYIDNELSEKKSIQIKKNIILNRNFREEFEKLLSLHHLLQNSFSKKEYLVKEDYTKVIFRKLDLMEEVYGKSIFPEIAGIFVVIFVGLFIAATLAIFAI